MAADGAAAAVPERWFQAVPRAAPDPVFGMVVRYREDAAASKLDLVVGAYRTDEGMPWLLPVVAKAEREVVAALGSRYDHEYLPIDGLAELSAAAAALALGDDYVGLKDGRVASVQTLSGTGALRIAGEFLKGHHPVHIVYVSNPTWGNHHAIFKAAGHEVRTYRYWNAAQLCLDFEGLKEDLRAAPRGAIVVLHSVAHNPTGVDPTPQQWREIIDICRDLKLIPIFDAAYLGFASGSVKRDRAAMRAAADAGFDMLICVSFSKNFGLYNERVGALIAVCDSASTAASLASQWRILIRRSYSNPPAHGARVVATVLNNPVYKEEWLGCIRIMADRVRAVRAALYAKLIELKTPGTWHHIQEQIGMFSYTGLTEKQCDAMISRHHVYLLPNGRLNMSAICSADIGYLAASIHDVVTTVLD